MIIRSRIVVPMVGEPIEDAAVVIAGNQIVGVGRFEEVEARYGGDVLEPVPVPEVSKHLHDWFESNPEWLGGFGLAPHALFTASAQLFLAASEISRKYQVRLTTHVAESREEMQMFRNANGSLFDFFKSIGRQLDDCGGTTPLSCLLQRNAVDERWIIAHLNELSEKDL